MLEPELDGAWHSRYAWWNVYPPGWDDVDGSPTGLLKELQTPFVGELFWAVAKESGRRGSCSCPGRIGGRRSASSWGSRISALAPSRSSPRVGSVESWSLPPITRVPIYSGRAAMRSLALWLTP